MPFSLAKVRLFTVGLSETQTLLVTVGTTAAKTVLRQLCSRADRGRSTSSSLRGEIEEAQVPYRSVSRCITFRR